MTADTAGSPGSAPGRALRILIVEDNFLAACAMSDLIRKWGHQVVGPVASVTDACRLTEEGRLNGAILDVNIRGGSSAEVARLLDEKHTPFFFVTGYASPSVLPDPLSKRCCLRKPVDERVLRSTIDQEFQRREE
jgi:CheY-like chemotaxis protein